MALTLEQEQALLALLDEQKLTLSELDSASELNGSDLILVRQGILDKSLKGETLKRYVTPPAASLTTSGLTKLSSAVNSSDEGIAATSKAVKSAYDLAGNALMKESNLADLTDVADALTNLGLGETIKLAEEALPKKGGEVKGDVIIDGILTTKNAEVVIEKDSGFSGIHIKNSSSQASSACGIDLSFGGAIMASIIGGMMPTGANYLDIALSPSGNISDRRQNAFTLNGDVKRMFFQNNWLLDGYVRHSDFTQSMADAGWIRFPNGTIIQWYWGATDANGWGGIVWPIAWPIRCHGVVAMNIAGDVPASAVAGVKRIDDRNFWVTLREITGAVSIKPFFCIGIGV